METWRTLKRLAGSDGELAHLLQRHLFVGFVVKVEGLAAAGVVADDAVEDDHRAVGALLGCGDEFLCVDDFASQADFGGGIVLRDASGAPPETGGRRPTSSPSSRMRVGWAYSWLTLTAMEAQVEAGTRAEPAAR